MFLTVFSWFEAFFLLNNPLLVSQLETTFLIL